MFDRKGNFVESEEHQRELSIAYTYDSCDRVVLVEDSVGAKLKLGYDCRGNLIYEEKAISDEVKQVIHYTYDKANNLVQEKEVLDSGLPAREGEKKLAITKYAYDEKGNELVRYGHTIERKLKEIKYQNQIHTTYEYDTDGNISRKTKRYELS